MPEVILLQDVAKLGSKGSVVEVSKGYMRNFLAPRKLAQPATKGALEDIQRRSAGLEARDAANAKRAVEIAEQLNNTVLTIQQQAGEDGRLFGSVTAQDIADAIQQARGVEVDRRRIHLEAPIKTVGAHSVVVELAPGVSAEVKTLVNQL